MKVFTVIGARPQFIKSGPVSLELKARGIEETLVHTGQHYDVNMSNIFFEQLGMSKPKYNLNINNLGHGAMVGRMLEKLEELLILEKPDLILVYGDTNSTLAAALSARKLHFKVAHVEAGLRSFNNRMPEETNRILTDRISDLLFCPTSNAITNLQNEGFNNFDCKIILSGDVMLDAINLYSQLNNHSVNDSDYILVTVHRAENTDNKIRLENIFSALNELAKSNNIIITLHPRTKAKLKLFNINTQNIKIIEPVGYIENINLLGNCKLLLTDSGGMQKEAFFLKKKCITLRDQTEWVELIENGYNKLVGADKNKIIEESNQIMNSTINFNKDLYGNGNARKIIVENIQNLNDND